MRNAKLSIIELFAHVSKVLRDHYLIAVIQVITSKINNKLCGINHGNIPKIYCVALWPETNHNTWGLLGATPEPKILAYFDFFDPK